MFEPLGTKLLGRRAGRHTCWADTLRRFLISILEFGFWIFRFFSAFWDVMGKPNERHRKEKLDRKNKKHNN